MSGPVNPAFAAFLAEFKEELVFAQIFISRRDAGYQLRHVTNRDVPQEGLKKIALSEVRSLVDATATRQFRPLKSAPNLSAGWILFLANEEQLELALNQFYPNALADWFSVRGANPPITHYREFTARQSGMYRITSMLSDGQAAHVIRACCHKNFCLKQRLWSVGGLSSDAPSEKSIVPCLEPCAILLEFARKGMRIEQEEKVHLSFSPSDIASLSFALQGALAVPENNIREADFAAAGNLRRMQLALEKLNSSGITLANISEGE